MLLFKLGVSGNNNLTDEAFTESLIDYLINLEARIEWLENEHNKA